MRKICSILILLVLTLPLNIRALDADYTVGSFTAYVETTGTTANSYPGTCQVVWDTAWQVGSKTITIINTHASNGLTYKIIAQPNKNIAKEFIYKIDGTNEEYAVVALTADSVRTEKDWDTIKVCLKTTSAGNHATFSVLPTGRR